MQDWLSTVNWQVWWQPKELLMVRPPALWELMPGYITFLAICLLLATVPFVLKKMHQGLRDRLLSFGWSQLIVGLILFFFRFYQIPYLGMDILRVLQYVWAIAWAVVILHYAFKSVKADKYVQTVEERRNQYLPKPKK